MSGIFELANARRKGTEGQQRHIERLERKVGQLIIERDWLAKVSKELGID